MDNEKQIVSCFREDGSFDFGACVRAPQVVGGVLLIFGGLLISYLLNTVIQLGNKPVAMLISLFCCFLCFSGAGSLVNYINAQREAKEKRKR